MKGPILTLGKYEILEQVGAGGMSTVYLARVSGEMGFEKLVSLKVLNEDASREDQLVKMFIDEAKLGARLSHPNVVSVLDFGQTQGRYFMAMEHVDGLSLKHVLKRLAASKKGQPLSVNAVVYVARAVASALSYVHDLRDEKGRPMRVVHRDLSPQNILIDRMGMVKLCDFGIAKGAFRQEMTREGILKGKAAYMAPEQASGQGVDRRTDLYALGLVMYEMLTLRPAIEGDDTAEILMQARKGLAPEKVEQAVEEPRLRAVMLKLLSPDKGARFKNADELIEALRDVPADEGEGRAELSRTVQKAMKRKTRAKGTRHRKSGQDTVARPESRLLARKLQVVLFLLVGLALAAVVMALLGISLQDLLHRAGAG